MAADFAAILRRIERRRKLFNLTERRLSVMAELSADYVRSARRNYERGKQHGISMAVATKLARILKTSPEWLMHGIGPEEVGSGKGAQPQTESIELRCVWEIEPNGHGSITVSETLGAHPSKTWGPMPSRQLADQLIAERKGVVERTLAGLVVNPKK
jgi:transcriptional regulator with XRE-family HTH domain